MKKFYVAQYFWVVKVLVFLGWIGNTGFFQAIYISSADPIDQAQVKLAEVKVKQFWSERLHIADSLETVGQQYSPWSYFCELTQVNQIWKDHGFDNWRVAIQSQEILVGRMEQNSRKGLYSYAEICRARDYFLPPTDPLIAAANKRELQQGVINWLWYQYVYGLPFVLILFGVWFRENEYFQRFIRKPLFTAFSVVLWPVVLYLVFEDKFKSHYYSVLAEMALQR